MTDRDFRHDALVAGLIGPNVVPNEVVVSMLHEIEKLRKKIELKNNEIETFEYRKINLQNYQNEIELENEELRACRKVKRGVCHQHCDEVKALQAEINRLKKED